MPRGDGTGPAGFGSMTGRKAGYCAGFSTPGFTKPGRMGFARRNFGGRGWRHCFYETGLPYWARKNYPFVNTEDTLNEEEALAEEVNYLEAQLDKVKERLNEVKRSKKEGPNNN